MQNFHNKTDITIKKYFSEPNFIDWTTQPRNHKIYPKFYRRFLIDEYEELEFIKEIGKVTFEKRYGNDVVSLRSNPSAGGLYPCEVYIQIRGVKGLITGIYHYEPLSNSLVLIHELVKDGLEYYINSKNQEKRFIFLVSNVYFRTSWKYDDRSIRYLLLDSGHQLATIYTSILEKESSIEVDFNFRKEDLNRLFGFEGFEFFQFAISIEPKKEREIEALRDSLPNVCGCDYQIRNSFIEEFYQKSLELDSKKELLDNYLKEFDITTIKELSQKRRSVRAFKKESITKDEYIEMFSEFYKIARDFGIEIYSIVNNIENMSNGLYKNVELIKEGEFKEDATKLALNQALGGNSSVLLIFSSKVENNYVKSTIFCGFIAHLIHLKALSLNIGSSTIGAYFDNECQKFLSCKDNILYMQAVGR